MRTPIQFATLAIVVAGCAGDGDDERARGDEHGALTATAGIVDTSFGQNGRLRLDGVLSVQKDGALFDAIVDGAHLVVEKRDRHGAVVTSGFGTAGRVEKSLDEVGRLTGAASAGGRPPLDVRFCGIVVDDSGTIAVSGLARERMPNGTAIDAGFVVLASADGAHSTHTQTRFDMSRTAGCGMLRPSRWGIEVSFMTGGSWGVYARVPPDPTLTPEALAQAAPFGGGDIGVTSDRGPVRLAGGGSIGVGRVNHPVTVAYQRPDGSQVSWEVGERLGSFETLAVFGSTVRILFSGGIVVRDFEGAEAGPTIRFEQGKRAVDLGIDELGRSWVMYRMLRSAGTVTEAHEISRFLESGAPDTSFGAQGLASVRGTSADEDVAHRLRPHADGMIVRSSQPDSSTVTWMRLR